MSPGERKVVRRDTQSLSGSLLVPLAFFGSTLDSGDTCQKPAESGGAVQSYATVQTGSVRHCAYRGRLCFPERPGTIRALPCSGE